MRSRRSTTLAVLAAGTVALLGLAGCSAQASDAADSGPVTIDFWHAMSGPAATELDTLVERYNAENPDGVTVKSSFQGPTPTCRRSTRRRSSRDRHRTS